MCMDYPAWLSQSDGDSHAMSAVFGVFFCTEDAFQIICLVVSRSDSDNSSSSAATPQYKFNFPFPDNNFSRTGDTGDR